MGKRSSFKRRPMDDYPTIDPRASAALIPHLHGVMTYAEPCAGNGNLIEQLDRHGLICRYRGDILNGEDALAKTHYGPVDAIITNPPWSRPILHQMILHFQRIAPTWLLFDSDWAYTKQSAPFLDQCSHVVAVGRLIWMEGTNQTGKDNCAWYRLHAQHVGGPRFIGHPVKEAA